jgi:hypothetical protein
MYLWTSAVLSNIQRVTISGVVSNWYFHRFVKYFIASIFNIMMINLQILYYYRHELDRNSKKVIDLALSRATTVSFGTVCLDGLIISFIQFIQYIIGFLKNVRMKFKYNVNIPLRKY